MSKRRIGVILQGGVADGEKHEGLRALFVVLGLEGGGWL